MTVYVAMQYQRDGGAMLAGVFASREAALAGLSGAAGRPLAFDKYGVAKDANGDDFGGVCEARVGELISRHGAA